VKVRNALLKSIEEEERTLQGTLDEPAVDDERQDPLLFSQFDDVNDAEKGQPNNVEEQEDPLLHSQLENNDMTCQECAVSDSTADVDR